MERGMQVETNESQARSQAAPKVVNFSVKYETEQGGRSYMEDRIRFALEKESDGTVVTSFFGLFDGHGGSEAADYAKENLLSHIVARPEFHSNDDSLVLTAIKDGFASIQCAMLQERNNNWPSYSPTRLSIAGTTASVVFFKNGKLYIANVGDSAVVLGYLAPGDLEKGKWSGKQLTKDHKPEEPIEKRRIEEAGAKIVKHNGCFRIKTQQPNPLLNVARSLGDIWSWNHDLSTYIVSPLPDTMVLTLDPDIHKCLILASDGLWNAVTAEKAVNVVKSSLKKKIGSDNPADRLVKKAKDNWQLVNFPSDNITAMSIVFDFVY